MKVDSRQEIELVRCVENDGNQKLHYEVLYKTILSFSKPSADVWICKGTWQVFAENAPKATFICKVKPQRWYTSNAGWAKPEIFWSHIYDQSLFDCNKSVTLPFPSLAEISVSSHHCHTVTVAQNNCSTMTTRGARAEWGSLSPLPEQLPPVPERAPPWTRCSEHRCFPKQIYWVKRGSHAGCYSIKWWHGSLVHAPGDLHGPCWGDLHIPLG